MYTTGRGLETGSAHKHPSIHPSIHPSVCPSVRPSRQSGRQEGRQGRQTHNADGRSQIRRLDSSVLKYPQQENNTNKSIAQSLTTKVPPSQSQQTGRGELENLWRRRTQSLGRTFGGHSWGSDRGGLRRNAGPSSERSERCHEALQ